MGKKRVIVENLIKIAVSLAVAALVLKLTERLVMPKYTDSIPEGGFIGEYYRMPDRSYDVIFLGDCEVYDCYEPMKLWQEYGINSYVRGSAKQTIWQSYYLLEDTLTYEKPQVVIFNVAALVYDKPVSEAYNRMTIDGMRWSRAKVGAILSSMTEDEHFVEYLFPLLRFHSRWEELSLSDLRYYLNAPLRSYHGYHLVTDAVPAGDIPEGRPLIDYSFGENAWDYMDRMRKLCEENGITLILVKAPILYPVWYDEYEAQVDEYAKENGLTYINFNELTDELDINYRTDTYDGGMHINLSGADKMTHYIGRMLAEMGVPDRRGEPKLNDMWDKDIERFGAEIKAD